jgi:hypothetical protein
MMDGLPAFHDYWDEVERGLVPLARFLRDAGRSIAWAMPEAAMQTADPRHYEVHKLVATGAPCLPVSVLMLDPLIHDLNGIDLRAALDGLRTVNPALYNAVIAFATARVPMRSFNTIADQYEILSPHYPATRAEWGFGRVAVIRDNAGALIGVYVRQRCLHVGQAGGLGDDDDARRDGQKFGQGEAHMDRAFGPVLDDIDGGGEGCAHYRV